MKSFMSKVCFTLFAIGVSTADSEHILIPIILVFAGSIGFAYLTKEDR